MTPVSIRRTPLARVASIAIAAAASFSIGACDEPRAPPPSSPSPTSSTETPASQAESTSEERVLRGAFTLWAEAVTKLIDEPTEDVLLVMAEGYSWQEVPEELARAQNAERAWGHRVGEEVILIVGDRDNSIAAIAMDGFDAQVVKGWLREFFELRSVPAPGQPGQATEMYEAYFEGDAVGIISLIYGTTSLTKGTGSLCFITHERAMEALELNSDRAEEERSDRATAQDDG